MKARDCWFTIKKVYFGEGHPLNGAPFEDIEPVDLNTEDTENKNQ